MTADLSVLEQAAARAGLPGLRAQEVPADRRRGTWFSFGGGVLRVSRAVLEHCPPEDAAALLVNAVLERRRLAPLRRRLLAGLAAAVLLALGVGQAQALAAAALGLAALLLLWVWWNGARAGAWLHADDDTVALLGDAEPLVRGLHNMSYEELRLGPLRTPARPQLQRRAERLVRLHDLRRANSCDLPRG